MLITLIIITALLISYAILLRLFSWKNRSGHYDLFKVTEDLSDTTTDIIYQSLYPDKIKEEKERRNRDKTYFNEYYENHKFRNPGSSEDAEWYRLKNWKNILLNFPLWIYCTYKKITIDLNCFVKKISGRENKNPIKDDIDKLDPEVSEYIKSWSKELIKNEILEKTGEQIVERFESELHEQYHPDSLFERLFDKYIANSRWIMSFVYTLLFFVVSSVLIYTTIEVTALVKTSCRDFKNTFRYHTQDLKKIKTIRNNYSLKFSELSNSIINHSNEKILLQKKKELLEVNKNIKQLYNLESIMYFDTLYTSVSKLDSILLNDSSLSNPTSVNHSSNAYFLELYRQDIIINEILNRNINESNYKPDSLRKVIAPAVKLLDLVLIGSLIVMVLIGGYENTVSRIGMKHSMPTWLGKLTISELKVKVAASIVIISSIHLLMEFLHLEFPMNSRDYVEMDYYYPLIITSIIHLVFILSALAITRIAKIERDSH